MATAADANARPPPLRPAYPASCGAGLPLGSVFDDLDSVKHLGEPTLGLPDPLLRLASCLIRLLADPQSPLLGVVGLADPSLGVVGRIRDPSAGALLKLLKGRSQTIFEQRGLAIDSSPGRGVRGIRCGSAGALDELLSDAAKLGSRRLRKPADGLGQFALGPSDL